MSFSYGMENRCLDFKNLGPIGIMDSGVGGLTVLSAISKYTPCKDIIYFGDTKHVPYGQKSKNEIVRYALQAINFLKSKGAKVILIACGTVTSYIDDIKNSLSEEIPIFGIIDAVSYGAVKTTRNGKIGVMCTPVSAKVGLFKKTILNLKSDCEVYTIGCPVLAPLIEEGVTPKNYEKLSQAAEFYVESLKQYGVDTIILGCTHYPIIKDMVKKYIGNEIFLIDPGEELASFLTDGFKNSNAKDVGVHNLSVQFFVSGDVQKFNKSISDIMEANYNPIVGQVDIESY